MFTTRFTLYLGILSCVPVVMSQSNITAIVGQNATLPCLVAGTYVLPGWSRDTVAINYQGFTDIHPSYAARFQIDPSDNKSLLITDVQESDEGMYQCSYSPSPAIFTGLIVNLPTPAIILASCFGKGIAVCIFFVLTIVDYIVVIIKGIYMLNNDDNRKRRQLPCCHYDGSNWRTQVWVILIIAAVIFIAVLAWFIAMMAIVDAFQEMTQSNCNVYIGLLSFEVIDFVLGVCLIICLHYIDYPTEINPEPLEKRSWMKLDVKTQSGDTKQRLPGVSTQHLLQTLFPPGESVSRKNVNLDPITPNYKNIFTTEFRRNNPGSEQSNIMISNRGLSAEIDQEYNKPRTNRLAPIDRTVSGESIGRKKASTDHTVMGESIGRKKASTDHTVSGESIGRKKASTDHTVMGESIGRKKKRKTKTSKDVKLDNVND